MPDEEQVRRIAEYISGNGVDHYIQRYMSHFDVTLEDVRAYHRRTTLDDDIQHDYEDCGGD